MEGQGDQPGEQGGPPPQGGHQQHPQAQHGQGGYHYGHGGGGRGSVPGISAEQKQQIAGIGWKLVIAAGVFVAFARFLAYLDFTDNANLEFENHLGFWSMWAGGLAMLALGLVHEDQGVVGRVALIFFGIVTLVLAPQAITII